MKKETENEFSDDEVLEDFKEALKEYKDFWVPQYKHSEELFRFWSGEQFTDAEIKDRRINSRPPLEAINITRSYVNSVVNPFRLSPNGVNLKIDDTDTSLLLNSVIHDIEEKSNADECFETAFENQVVSGIGWVVVTTEYESDESMDQIVKILPIRNSSQCYLAPAYEQIDGSDAPHGAIIDYEDPETVEELYGEDCCVMSAKNASPYKHWLVPRGLIPVVAWYQRVEKNVKRWFFADGTYIDQTQKPLLPTIGSRMVSVPKIMCYKIVGEKIVERTELPIRYVPLVPFHGDRLMNGTGVRWTGIIDWMRSSQRMINTYFNSEKEMVDDAPISPWIGTVAQFKGLEQYWERSNKTKFSALAYNETGTGAPTRAPRGIDSTPFATGRQAAVLDIQRATGIYDPLFGQNNETGTESGVALGAKTEKGELQNVHYYQNARQSIRHVGRIILELLAYIYDTERTFKVADNDEEKAVNANISDVLSRFKKDEIKLEVSVGAMLKSKRDQEEIALNHLMSILPPEKQTAFIDVMASRIESKDSQLIRDRVKKLVPIEFQDNGQAPIDPAAMAALESANQAIAQFQQNEEMLKQYIVQLQNQVLTIENDSQAMLAGKQMDNDYKVLIEQIQQEGSDRRELAKIISENNARQDKKMDELVKSLAPLVKVQEFSGDNVKSLLEGKQFE